MIISTLGMSNGIDAKWLKIDLFGAKVSSSVSRGSCSVAGPQFSTAATKRQSRPSIFDIARQSFGL